ncbi:MAG: O-acetylhomoserine sulfhydrylase / O-succinylhomoserine sulfhydrylase, partial [uncultured Thermomicrobiales bacterium]
APRPRPPPPRLRHPRRSCRGGARPVDRRPRRAGLPEQHLRLPLLPPDPGGDGRSPAPLLLRPRRQPDGADAGAEAGRPRRGRGRRRHRLGDGRHLRRPAPPPGRRRPPGCFPGPLLRRPRVRLRRSAGLRRRFDPGRHRRPGGGAGRDHPRHPRPVRRNVRQPRDAGRGSGRPGRPGRGARHPAGGRQHVSVARPAAADRARRGVGGPQHHQVPLRPRPRPRRRRLRLARAGRGHRRPPGPPRGCPVPAPGLAHLDRDEDPAAAGRAPRRDRAAPGAIPGGAPRGRRRPLPRPRVRPRARRRPPPARGRGLRRDARLRPGRGRTRLRPLPRFPRPVHHRRQPRRTGDPDLAVPGAGAAAVVGWVGRPRRSRSGPGAGAGAGAGGGGGGL